jgi:hypothetical protein
MIDQLWYEKDGNGALYRNFLRETVRKSTKIIRIFDVLAGI